MSYMKVNVEFVLGFLVSAIGFTISCVQNMYLLTPKVKYKLIKMEQTNYWLQQNPQYDKLKGELDDLIKEKRRIL